MGMRVSATARRPGGGGVDSRMAGPGDPAVEDIRATTTPPTVRREGVEIRAVVQGTREGNEDGQI